ncbi:hypothetical protein CANCADRAFT_13309, partial [Tortispora caseinolytica NRRL Y-17796]
MSFQFNWHSFTEANFYSKARALLTEALNNGSMPPIIVDKVSVSDFDLGSTPPHLEILEIGDFSADSFHGIFKLNYAGDARLSLQTKIEANPLQVHYQSVPEFAGPRFLAASSSLTMPLILTLSEFRLNGIVVFVYSRAKGLTIVFPNDVLESIKVSSTFDFIPSIARYLQAEIENRLRLFFRDDFPIIMHKIS